MFAAKTGPTQRTVSDAYNNIYLNAILQTLRRSPADAGHVFKELMEFYVKTSAETFLRLPRRWFSHADHARECIALLNNRNSKDAMPEVIQYLNSIAAIKSSGDFGLALSTYFSIFPEYLSHCSAELYTAVNKLDVWEPAISSWLNRYMTENRRGKGSREHEVLEQLSTVIPDKLVESYADFLMKELKTSHHHETIKGLYNGWIYAALGKLLPRLTIAKQEGINKLLLAAFDSRLNDVSLIGLSAALSMTVQPADRLNAIAEKLYLYVMRELGELTKMQEDHRTQTEFQYAEKAFVLLKKLEGFYNPDMKNGLVNAMISSEEAFYKLRHNVLALESWVSDDKKLKIMEGLNIHDRFLNLAPLFWHWLVHDKTHKTAWARCDYSKHINLAKDDLRGIFTHFTPVTDQLKLLIADNSLQRKQRNDIIEDMINELVDHNSAGSANMVRKEVHQALVAAKEWAEAEDRFKIANLLHASCHERHGTHDPDDVRVSAGLAASEYCELFTPEQTTALRDDLLELLDGPDAIASPAAAALENFMSRGNALPALMTALLTKPDNDHAQLLLSKLHAEYLQLDKEVEKRIALRG